MYIYNFNNQGNVIIELKNKYESAFQYLLKKSSLKPKTALILGSGLGNFVDDIQKENIIPTNEIPFYPKSTVEGHSGKIILGKLKDIPVMVFQGRIHYYEGYDISETVFPSVLSHLMNIENIIFTNVSGGINYKPGNIVLLTDHINGCFRNPVPSLQNAFPSIKTHLSKNYYSEELLKKAELVSNENQIEITKGIYAWTHGPSYETPSEIRMFKTMGADMVGMSTVPEVLAANFFCMKVMGISLISNYASGITQQKLSHTEVIEMGDKYKTKLNYFIQKLLLKISE